MVIGDILSGFECKKCGNCCRPSGSVDLSGDDITAISQYLGMNEDRFIQDFAVLKGDRSGLSIRMSENGPCIFLSDSSECSINAVKPRQCREFPQKWNYEGYEKICEGMKEANK